ncbi:MarR family winged helix-turn-helix transcriptional regulator [Marivivens niveibacter]|uniref:MarR family winged helix-turn-helix transcriptional regulator n=1 Tax=Marivivens niveibacter TaxID=1930667 RepID=UPI001F0A06F0|nr:helix-turn-helix domain-containing protein [Marivivens niveibacter]
MMKLPPHFHADVPETLTAAGFESDAIDHLLELDAVIFQWHRMSSKGEVPRKLLAEMESDVDIGQFYSMTAVARIIYGIGRDEPQEATIGLLAEELNIDPSRASRVASDLIKRGLVRRRASQEDGRKSILEFTQEAIDLLSAYRALKWTKAIEVYKDWPAEDIAAFSRLLQRYVDGVGKALHGKE